MVSKNAMRSALDDAAYFSRQALERYFDGGAYRLIVDRDGDFPALEEKLLTAALALVKAAEALDLERAAAAERDKAQVAVA